MKSIEHTRGAIRLWLVERLGTCERLAPVMSESLDQRLGFVTWFKLNLHLSVCKWCRRYLAQIRLVNRIARRAGAKKDPIPSLGLSTDARRRIAAAICEMANRDR